MKRVLPWILVFSALAAPASASPLVWPVAAPGAKLRVHTARVVVAASSARPDFDVWTVDFEVSGKGEAGFAFPLARGEDAARIAPRLAGPLDALDHATAPRIVERPAWDPCAFGFDRYARVYPRTAEIPWRFGPEGWTAKWPAVDPPRLEEATFRRTRFAGSEHLAKHLRAEELRPLAGELPSPAAAAVLRFTPTETPRFTPVVRIERPRAARAALDLAPLGAAAPPGRLLKVELFTFDDATGLEPASLAASLPTEVALPELAFEHPEDTRQVIMRQRRILDGEDAIVRQYRGRSHGLEAETLEALGAPHPATAARFGLAFGSRGRPPLELVPTANGENPLAPLWFVHRAWREPMRCAGRVGYLAAVAKHQEHVLRTFANMTGRPMKTLIELSRERGYLLEPFGQLHTADPKDVQLEPVQIDRSAWR